MQPRISIRSYTRNPRSHHHDYAQVVVPLKGKIILDLFDAIEPTSAFFESELGVGQAVLIENGVIHRFSSHENARFLVADIAELPEPPATDRSPLLSVSEHFFNFCLFAEQQLNSQFDPRIETAMTDIFVRLLAQQSAYNLTDKRIERVLAYLESDLSRTPELRELAELACLSLSHFKEKFRAITGETPLQYLLHLRMKKARALLSHSDTPIALIALLVGYSDASAFSRRFRNYWGQSPKDYRPS